MSAKPYQGHRWQWFGPSTYSQCGEDLIFVSTFNRLGLHKPSYLDIGANHPTIISNTALLYSRGSRGINVDANPEHMDELRRERPHDINLNVAIAPSRGILTFYRFTGEASGQSSFSKRHIDDLVAKYPTLQPEPVEIETVTINDIVDHHANGTFPDILSIDVESLDTAILNSADFSRSRPKLICTEALNSQGEEPEIYSVMRRQGFERYVRCGGNMIFLDKEIICEIW